MGVRKRTVDQMAEKEIWEKRVLPDFPAEVLRWSGALENMSKKACPSASCFHTKE